jgi:hypothetical protein
VMTSTSFHGRSLEENPWEIISTDYTDIVQIWL